MNASGKKLVKDGVYTLEQIVNTYYGSSAFNEQHTLYTNKEGTKITVYDGIEELEYFQPVSDTLRNVLLQNTDGRESTYGFILSKWDISNNLMEKVRYKGSNMDTLFESKE